MKDSTRSKHRLKGDYTFYDFYRWYKRREDNDLKQKVVHAVVYTFFRLLFQDMIKKLYIIRIPRVGTWKLTRVKVIPKVINGKVCNMKVDWGRSDKILKETGKRVIVYYDNSKYNDYIYSVRYMRDFENANMKFYKFNVLRFRRTDITRALEEEGTLPAYDGIIKSSSLHIYKLKQAKNIRKWKQFQSASLSTE